MSSVGRRSTLGGRRGPAIEPLPTCLVFRRNLVEELKVLPADIRPEHGLRILVRFTPSFDLEGGIAEESQRGVGHRVALAERHEQAAPVGQDFFGVEVRRADHGPAGCQGIRQGAAGNLVLSRIRGDVHVASLQMHQKVGKAEILVHKTHVLADAQRFGHLDQAFPVSLALMELDLRMGGADDQVDGLGKAATTRGMA